MELHKKHGMEKFDTVTIPIATARIDADLQDTPTYQTKYYNMIGGLMYLTASRPDTSFATFVCARYQAHPTDKHLKETVGQIMIDHALNYALTTTADVPTVYIQQFWKTVKQVPNANDIIRFTIDKETITYTIVGREGIIDKKFPSIAQRLDENYHSIKDDIPLVSVYTTGNVIVRGILILDVPMIKPQPVKSAQGTNRTPRATKTPTPNAEVAQKKRKSKAVARESNSIFQDDDDSSNKIKPGSHKENLEVVDDNDVDENVDKEKKNDEVEEKKDNKNNDNDDHVDHTLTRGKELMANVSPTPGNTSKDPNMSQRTSSTSKTVPGSVAEPSRRHDQLSEQLKNTFITKEYFEGKMKEMYDTLNNLIPKLTVAKTNELMKKAIPRMVNDAVNKDRGIFADAVPELVLKEFATHALKKIEELFKHHMKNKVLNVHPIVSISTAKTTADLKQQL
ncbi:hypothetical protein Tco_0676829 [Tanacetum coccineum]